MPCLMVGPRLREAGRRSHRTRLLRNSSKLDSGLRGLDAASLRSVCSSSLQMASLGVAIVCSGGGLQPA